ncbi:MAG: hypothetical protein HQL40_10460 [Alphaproteobacteria bacterium]|nr:hypothetical protein [Alphaproteobacteria bacterium]
MRKFLAAAALAVLLAQPAEAHILKVFAAVENGVIQGEAFFGGGKVARNKRVDVLGPDGGKIGEVQTDDTGKFTYQPKKRVDHTFVIEGDEGHKGEWTVEAVDLPAGVK